MPRNGGGDALQPVTEYCINFSSQSNNLCTAHKICPIKVSLVTCAAFTISAPTPHNCLVITVNYYCKDVEPVWDVSCCTIELLSEVPSPAIVQPYAPSPINHRQVRRAAVMRLPRCPAPAAAGLSESAGTSPSLSNRHRIRGKISLGFEGGNTSCSQAHQNPRLTVQPLGAG